MSQAVGFLRKSAASRAYGTLWIGAKRYGGRGRWFSGPDPFCVTWPASILVGTLELSIAGRRREPMEPRPLRELCTSTTQLLGVGAWSRLVGRGSGDRREPQ